MSDLSKLDPNFAGAQAGEADWYDVAQMPLEGKGWQDTQRFYDRLPARAKPLVRPEVWELSQFSAGLCVSFETDSRSISAQWSVPSYYTMRHFAPSGMAGLDLYVRHEGKWRWLGLGRPENPPHLSAQLIAGLPEGNRQYRLYLPTYHGVDKVYLGVDIGSRLTPLPARSDKPMLFYGSSITHGGCASRSGMTYPAILGRRMNRPHINLGFSGNAQMEAELADLLAELDPCVYVLDALPNLQPPQVTQRLRPFVECLRRARPDTPIVLVESITYQDAFLCIPRRQRCTASNAALAKAYGEMVRDGIAHLHLVKGEGLLGDDGEATVDGVHPTDVGFLRIADVLEGRLRNVLA